MENSNNRIRNFILLSRNKIKAALSAFSKIERVVFLVFLGILALSTIVLLEKVNLSFMESVPAEGGNISEGIIGSPRFVNPVLAYSPVDNDLVSLVYSGLLRKDLDGNLVPDLAEKYEISKDGLNYTFTLKNKIFFQDGKPVTADDVVFTVDKVKDPIIKSPKKSNWDGVSVTKVDERTVVFSLKQPYASFLDNTTLGILPEHLWANSPIEINESNINPVGSGPYRVTKTSKQSSGIINSFTLKSFDRFALGKPHIDTITFNFYPNESDLLSALESGNIEQASSVTPKNAETLKEKNYSVLSSVLPRVFGLFFNQSQNQIFTNKNIVRAIDLAIDKDKIIKDVFSGYSTAISSPIPPNMLAYQSESNTTPTYAENLAKAQAILAKDGWVKSSDGFLTKTTSTKKTKGSAAKKTTASLAFSISTGNAPELAQTAEIIRQNLTDLGIKVDVKTFEIGNLNQAVIRPRKYDALLFGQIINNESDLFAFWHSSQRKDPGLNIAMYTNAKADKILEDAFTTIDPEARVKKYAQFEAEVTKDLPAVFIYSPDFIYVVSKNLKGINVGHIISPSDRFKNVYLWYIRTDSIWKIFTKH